MSGAWPALLLAVVLGGWVEVRGHGVGIGPLLGGRPRGSAQNAFQGFGGSLGILTRGATVEFAAALGDAKEALKLSEALLRACRHHLELGAAAQSDREQLEAAASFRRYLDLQLSLSDR